MIHILILNYNRPQYTVASIESLIKSSYKNFTVHLLDNGSDRSNFDIFQRKFSNKKGIHIYRIEKNRNFAGGNNYILKKAMSQVNSDDMILFLNNDTEIKTNFLEKIYCAATKNKGYDIFVPRMIKLDDPREIDNLGLVLGCSGIAFNRKSSSQTLFGPCGGCAIITKQCLETIYKKTGEYFDEDFVCYAEDADLAWRALLLGYKPLHVDDAICYHKVGGTNGSDYNENIMYHGLRNSLFNLVKNASMGFLVKNAVAILTMQSLIFFRFVFTRRILVLFKIYLDFLRLLPKMLKKRTKIQSTRRKNDRELRFYFSKQFYDWKRIRDDVKNIVK